MSLLEDAPGLLEAMRGEMTPKFLATRSLEGVPNVVPCVSLLPTEDREDVLFFGNFLLRKSIKNLESDPRVGILVITTELNGWVLKGDFLEFQSTGPYYDRQMNSNLLRYNAYTGIRNAGLIRVTSVEGKFNISRMQVVLEYTRARLSVSGAADRDNGGVKIPLPVRKEFARMIAVKVLAWIDEDGTPIVIPALSMQPAGEKCMVAWLGDNNLPVPQSGSQVATNILTFEAISYQAKGRWSNTGKAGVMEVEEIYAGGPPYPGGRVA
jgi:hypothetical protein